MIDVFYTPDTLAALMVQSLPKGFSPSRIVDFSAGEGSLLLAAESFWPNASVHANDICPRSVRRLRKLEPSWSVSCADFLSTRSRCRSKFGSLTESFDLILLNPPFSQKGVKPVSWPGAPQITTGQAALFVYIALGYLAKSGYLLAILPDGCLSSERDRDGWVALASVCDIEVIETNPINSFKGVSARTSIVRIRKKLKPAFVKLVDETDYMQSSMTKVIRGSHQMHSLKKDCRGIPLIHTSELRDGAVKVSKQSIATKKIIKGPALLFPRVGLVTPQKVCLLECSREVALSDCVLAVQCETSVEVELLRNEILKVWPIFAENYRGTGAPYITLERASKIISVIQHRIIYSRPIHHERVSNDLSMGNPINTVVFDNTRLVPSGVVLCMG